MDSNLDPTQVDFDPMAESRAFKEMMKLFEELSFMERIKRTLRGINMPHDSGEYKFAKLQIQRLAGPAMAIVLPLLIVVVLLSIKTHGQSGTGIVAVEIVEPTVIDDLEHEEAPPPEDFEFEPLDTEYDGPTENFAPETATFNQDVPVSPKPAEVNSVAIIKSPIVMRNIIGSRNPGQRG
jgi:hypothetical protein